MDSIKPLEDNINIEVLDKTGKDDLKIVLFAWNTAVKGECVAWEVLDAKAPKTVILPSMFTIEVRNDTDKVTKSITGTHGKWYEIHREKKEHPITIKEVHCTKKGAEDLTCHLHIKNVHPSTPSYLGVPYDICIWKNSKLMLKHKEIPVDKEDTFEMTSIMNFGVTTSKKVCIGEMFNPATDLLGQHHYNMRKFMKGMKVTVKCSPGSHNFTFIVDPM